VAEIIGRTLIAMCVLGVAAAAHAQATTNPNLNAQLLVAARQGDLQAVQRALAQGAAVDSRNRLGKTPLLMAAEKGNEPLAALALRAGANVNVASLEGVTPLMAASYGGHAGVAKILLDRMHKPAIVYAAGMGRTEVVGLLLERGVPIDAAYEHQLTPLMWAAGQGQEATVRLLLARGAKTDLRDDRGLTAYDIAQQTGQSAVVMLLQPKQ
jgi:ankyrin repeat protein